MKKKKKERYAEKKNLVQLQMKKTLQRGGHGVEVLELCCFLSFYVCMYIQFPDEYQDVQFVGNCDPEFEVIYYIYLHDRYAGYFNIYIRRY